MVPFKASDASGDIYLDAIKIGMITILGQGE
jgi:hypothetical protein